MNSRAAEELSSLDALAQAELARRGEVSARELVDAAIARAESVNPRLNAVVALYAERARREAEKPRPGPFSGVPILLKDLATELAGEPLTAGSRFLEGFAPKEDSAVVRRLKGAGFVILGKSSVSEFGMCATTEPALFGPCGNPWDASRSAGGSSGGAAAAVAAGIVPIAHANDGGASIRAPASACGVFGLKPTRHRVSWAPVYGDYVSGLAVEHGLTRSVRDSAALLDVLSGPEPGDPGWAPPPPEPFAHEVLARPGRLRVAVTADCGPRSPDADARAALEDAASLCRELGHELVERRLPFPRDWGEMLLPVKLVECAWQIDDWARRTGRRPSEELFEPETWELYRRGREVGGSDYLLAWQGLQRAAREAALAFLDVDVWLTPCTLSAPPALGWYRGAGGPWERYQAANAWLSPYTVLWAVSGQPAMSVPLWRAPSGLPVGAQFAGRWGEESTLLRLAAQLERARPWAGRLGAGGPP